VIALEEQMVCQLRPIKEQIKRLDIQMLEAEKEEEEAKAQLAEIKARLTRCIDNFASAKDRQELEASRPLLQSSYDIFLTKPADAIQLDAKKVRLQKEREQSMQDWRATRDGYQRRIEGLEVVREVVQLEERQKALRLEQESLLAMQRGFESAARVPS